MSRARICGLAFAAAFASTAAHADVKESVANFCNLQKRQLTDEVEILKDNMQRANSLSESDLTPSIQLALQTLEKDRQTIARGCKNSSDAPCPSSTQFRRAMLQEMTLLNHNVGPYLENYFVSQGFTVQDFEISQDSQERNSFASFHLMRNGTSIHMGFDPVEFLTNSKNERFIHFYTDGQKGTAPKTPIYFDQKNRLQLNVLAPDAIYSPLALDDFLKENIPACKQTASWLHQAQWTISTRLMKLGEQISEAVHDNPDAFMQGNASQ
jgi:hypothetical protein